MFCSESREQSTYRNHCKMAIIKVNACYICSQKLQKFKQGGAPDASLLALPLPLSHVR